jgi:uncharacterized protein
LEWILVFVVGVFAGVLSGIVGTGSSMILLPILVFVFGAKAAVPMMAISALLANAGRIVVWWSEIRWRAVLWYLALAVPGAALGADTLIAIPETLGNLVLGGLLILLVPTRYVIRAHNIGSKPIHLLLAGGIIGFLTGLVASSGPLSLAAFSSFGLVKTGLIATEAAASFFVFGSKVTTFNQLGAMSSQILIDGAIVGGAVIVGTYGAKHILQRMSVSSHDRVIDVVLLIAGLAIIFA